MYLHRISLGVFACALTSIHAETTDSEATGPIYVLDEYVVSAGPLLRPIEDFASPFSSLDSEELSERNGSSLGALLDGEPGVSASAFAAGASRPIIRGFDGPRVRILDSGVESVDVSSTSPDHGVAAEPLLTERVEIIRGPATLLYGSSAIGGVVNVVGREIPREPVDGAKGAAEFRYDSVSDGRIWLGYTTVGGDNWAVSVTGLTREADNYEIPGDAESKHAHEHEAEEEEHEAQSGLLENSFVETDTYSIGGSWFFNKDNHFGIAYSQYDSLYGVPGHEHHHEEDNDEGHEEEEHGVSIDLKRKRFDAELEAHEPGFGLQALRLRFAYTDYEHTELEGDKIGTVFRKEGWEFRAEGAHQAFAFFEEGVVGLQVSDSDFSATGEEGGAFGPPSTTRNQAIFISEHIHGDPLHFEFGGRLENQTINADGAADDYSDVALSLAASTIWHFNERHSLAFSLQRSQRHPTAIELYADGAHLATSQYELGDEDLELETAYGADLRYRYSYEDWSGSVSAFYTYFEDYIYAENLGIETDSLDSYQFTAVDASFYGFEGNLDYTLFSSEQSQVVLGIMGDYVRARNEDDDNNLPRIPPLRLGTRLRIDCGQWSGGVLLRYSFKQDDTAPEEEVSDGYTELSLNLSRQFELEQGVRLTFFAQAENLLDETIRPHTSFLKEKAPLPGRNFVLGARVEF
ncbi:TonB-dependent receptor [Coraliomargarita parva]|uniref:TonB-dependent receptor n=1 Tax=Coraliomargarita parva TaxID=3014050 RepID=UPI0022B55864|nr:TonB-dependent receptor [Coraliomargarita parva]